MSVTKVTYRSDTAAGDDANIGFTSAEGLILTGQGSTNDVTIKNDADADVLEIPTGTTNVTVVGTLAPAGQFLSSDGSAGAPGLAFSGDTDHGFFRTSDKLGYSVGGSERIRFDGKLIFVGDTANASNSIGITLNQDTSDDAIFALKSSDVAHGETDFETDTFCDFRKRSATGGGLTMNIAGENAANGAGNWNVLCIGNQADNAFGTGDLGLINFTVGEVDGSGGFNALSSNDCIFSLRRIDGGGGGRTIFGVDLEGDIHVDGSTSLTAFDEYDDAALIRAHEIDRTPSSIIRTEFDKWVSYNKKSLEDAGILNVMTPEKIERGDISLINTTQLQRLHSGAIVQQRAMFETMKQVAEEMLPGFSKKLNERLEAQSLPALPA